MILSTAALVLVTACAPQVGVHTAAGLVYHESGWQQYAIGDNTARRAYFPSNYRDAVFTVIRLRSIGHDLDAGYAQINDTNWSHYGLTPYTVFDSCTNISVGADVLTRCYKGALASRFKPGDDALTHALSCYNSGHYYAAIGYAHGVISDARAIVIPPPPVFYVPFTPPTKRSTVTSRTPSHLSSPGLIVNRDTHGSVL